MLAGRAEPAEVWDAMARLLDFSLVVQRGDGRFTMPERVRRHAVQFLDARDDAQELRGLHTDVVLETVQRLVQHDRHVRFRTAMAELEDFLPEIQHAFRWAADADRDTYRMLLGSCGWAVFWFDRFKPSWRAELVAFARAEDPGDLAQGYVWGFACTRAAGVPDLTERRRWLDGAVHRFVELESHRWVCEMFVTRYEWKSRPAMSTSGSKRSSRARVCPGRTTTSSMNASSRTPSPWA